MDLSASRGMEAIFDAFGTCTDASANAVALPGIGSNCSPSGRREAVSLDSNLLWQLPVLEISAPAPRRLIDFPGAVTAVAFDMVGPTTLPIGALSLDDLAFVGLEVLTSGLVAVVNVRSCFAADWLFAADGGGDFLRN